MSDSTSGLLAELEGRGPDACAKLLGKALGGPASGEIDRALRSDPRFGDVLRRIAGDPALIGKKRGYLGYLTAQRYEPAVPELAALFARASFQVADEAANALVAISSEASLRAMADALPTTRCVARSLDACLALAERKAPSSKAVAAAFRGYVEHHQALPSVRSILLYWMRDHRELFHSDDGWLSFAIAALREGDAPTKAAAQELFAKVAMPAQRERALAELAAAKAPSADENKKVRAQMLALEDSLPSGAFTRAPRNQPARLAALEALVGKLPVAVRAFYEIFDAIRIPAKGPKVVFQIYSLAEVIQAAKAHAGQPVELPVGPDGHTRAGFSGGPPVAFTLPTHDDDPQLLYTKGSPRFSAFVERARAAAKKSTR